MGEYAVTGGSSGIGAAVVELLKKDGNEVINIDLKNGDICANLATVEGRQAAIDVYTKDVLTDSTESCAMPAYREAAATMSL